MQLQAILLQEGMNNYFFTFAWINTATVSIVGQNFGAKQFLRVLKHIKKL